ncbi:MAG: DUF3987 domain-containing protein [Methyloceanibacter sp.]|uniref:YfjI family protein n=1 Tax=Methyloceanibacter sp. TaxID=1965321 RepID=UPI003D9BCE88
MSMAAEKVDYGMIPVLEVARALLGHESNVRSTAAEKHFDGHAGLFVNIHKNRWFSHGQGRGGDAIQLVRDVTHCDFPGAKAWLRQHGFDAYVGEERQPRKIAAEYDYVSEDGEVLYQAIRFEPKGFSQRRSDGNGGWVWKGPERAVPYRLPELIKSGDAPVLIAAGEKDVDNLRALGFTATCNHGGEGKWWNEITPWLKDRRVFLLLDNDEQGEKHLEVVAPKLHGVVSELRVVRFPELPEKGDVSDFITERSAAGADTATIKSELAARFRDALVWELSIGVSENHEWPAPTPLPEGLSPVAALDTALLPKQIEPWVGDISERMQCPPDFVGMTALVALGSVLGRKIGIAPEKKTDWFEVANLWGCAVGRPGVMKTPAIGEALKPLHRLDVKAREAYETQAAEYAKTFQLWKMRKEAAEATFKTALKKSPIAEMVFSDVEPTEPVERRYITNDTTYEKLGEILSQNPSGVLAHRDELVSLLRTLDREEYAAARGFFLTAWGGKERYTFDRIGRGRVHIEAACLSMIGSTQPGKLAEYVRRAVSGGSGDDGLIQRFGMMIWPDQAPEWESVDRYPKSEARESAWGVFETFETLDPTAIGAVAISDFQSVPVLRLHAEAHDLFQEWRKDLERLLRSDDLSPALESHFAKYRKLVPALALISHLADAGGGNIGKAAMLRALGLVKYLETHARRAYGAGPEAETAAAKMILKHIRIGNLKDGFSAREVHQHHWSNLAERDQVQAGLDLLCDYGWLAAEDKEHASRGRPTVQYRINPRGSK